MKTAKMVIYIASIVLSLFLVFQSCAAGISNALSANGSSSGTGGMFLAICFLISGIVGLVTRKSVSRGGTITAGCLYLAGAFFASLIAAGFPDLYIWSGLGAILGAFILVTDILGIGRK